MITPCKCTGSIEYAHEHCMIEWIKRRLENEPKKKPCCEVCGSEFKYRESNRRHFDVSVLWKHCDKEPKSLACFFVVYGLFFVGFFAIIGLVAAGKNDKNLFINSFLNKSSGMTIVISVLAVYCLAMIVITVLFISEYLVS